MNADKIRSLSTEAMKDAAWRLLTNVRQCGGASRKGRLVASRRVWSLGGRFWILLPEGPRYASEWGLAFPGDVVPEGAVTGRTLDAIAARIGNGDARKGWAMVRA